MASEPFRLSATEAVSAIAGGTLTAEALARSCLERIQEREPAVAAWAHLDPGLTLARAREVDAGRARGPLGGVPVGFKDIVDTVDMPTAYNSNAFRGHIPTRDASCVALCRRAGAVAMGKTATTEFAFRYPGPTSNPHDRRHTPGGSSSGSAAAVADLHVPLAIGTQTGGSVIRPAAYCGVWGFKPTFNAFSFAGVSHLAESFDTLGCMARTLDDIALFRCVLSNVAPVAIADRSGSLRVAVCRTPYWDQAEAATRERLEQTADALGRAGAQVDDLEIDVDGAALDAANWLVNKVEGARSLGGLRDSFPDNVSQAVRDLVDEGRSFSFADYAAALKLIDGVRRQLDAAMTERFDVILTPSAVGEAPAGLESTGPITFNFIWTITGMPALTMPAGTGPSGLPIGIQLVARRHGDEELMAIARQVERALT